MFYTNITEMELPEKWRTYYINSQWKCSVW